MTDREQLEAVAASYNALMELMRQQQTTQAKMIRLCLHRITRDPSAFDIEKSRRRVRERKEAIKGLEDLASMLEAQSVR